AWPGGRGAVRSGGVGVAGAASWGASKVGAGRLGLVDLLPVVTPAVVLAALVRIGQDRVRLTDLFEQRLRFFVARVDVGVMLTGQLAVGGLDVLVGSGARHAEHRVVVTSGIGRHAARLLQAISVGDLTIELDSGIVNLQVGNTVWGCGPGSLPAPCW